MENFEQIIKANRPNISQSSVKTYLSNIKSVSKSIGKPLYTIADIVANEEPIYEYLDKQKINVRKTKMSAFVVLLDKGHDKNDADTDKVLKRFRKRITEDGVTYDKREEKQILSESQKQNYISWPEVLRVYSNLKTQAEPLFKLERLNIGQFKTLQSYVLLSVYVLIPPRRSMDYADFKIRNIDKESDNYMTIDKRKASFVFNKYKNASRLGRQTVEIPNSLKLIVTKWIKKNPYDWLIVNQKGNHITQAKINDILNDIFGKRIGSSMLRHIYITDKYGHVDLKDLRDTTEAMGSSDIDRTLKYVSKNEA
jgi:hypothetical protein